MSKESELPVDEESELVAFMEKNIRHIKELIEAGSISIEKKGRKAYVRALKKELASVKGELARTKRVANNNARLESVRAWVEKTDGSRFGKGVSHLKIGSEARKNKLVSGSVTAIRPIRPDVDVQGVDVPPAAAAAEGAAQEPELSAEEAEKAKLEKKLSAKEAEKGELEKKVGGMQSWVYNKTMETVFNAKPKNETSLAALLKTLTKDLVVDERAWVVSEVSENYRLSGQAYETVEAGVDYLLHCTSAESNRVAAWMYLESAGFVDCTDRETSEPFFDAIMTAFEKETGSLVERGCPEAMSCGTAAYILTKEAKSPMWNLFLPKSKIMVAQQKALHLHRTGMVYEGHLKMGVIGHLGIEEPPPEGIGDYFREKGQLPRAYRKDIMESGGAYAEERRARARVDEMKRQPRANRAAVEVG